MKDRARSPVHASALSLAPLARRLTDDELAAAANMPNNMTNPAALPLGFPARNPLSNPEGGARRGAQGGRGFRAQLNKFLKG